MASPQVEDGHLKIADGLLSALQRTPKLDGTDWAIITAVMQLTYRHGVKQTEITPQDLYYKLGTRTSRIKTALTRLVERNIIRQYPGDVLGIQKDFDKWDAPTDQTANLAVIRSNNIYITNTSSIAANLAVKPVSARIVDLALSVTGGRLSEKSFRAEQAMAAKLYREALDLTLRPETALFAIKDYYHYLSEDDYSKQLKRPVTFAYMNFRQWYRSLPKKKPHDVREWELQSGKRMRYDLRSRRWRTTNDPISARVNRVPEGEHATISRAGAGADERTDRRSAGAGKSSGQEVPAGNGAGANQNNQGKS